MDAKDNAAPLNVRTLCPIKKPMSLSVQLNWAVLWLQQKSLHLKGCTLNAKKFFTYVTYYSATFKAPELQQVSCFKQ